MPELVAGDLCRTGFIKPRLIKDSPVKKIVFVPLLTVIFLVVMFAQDNSAASPQSSAPGQDAAPQQANQPPGQNDQMPIFRVQVYARTTKAVNYRHRGGSTTVDFRGTDLMPEVAGHAKVDGKAGHLAISAELTHMQPASKFRRPVSHLRVVGHHSRRPRSEPRRSSPRRERQGQD